MSESLYLISFGNEGYELMLNVTDYYNIEQENLMRKLQGVATKQDNLEDVIRSMSFRFRFNSHRHIETYTIMLDDSNAKDVSNLLTYNSEEMKDIIRSKGEIVNQLTFM